ncbi:hypothetical protein DVH24_042750, partial [Malus domestica]
KEIKRSEPSHTQDRYKNTLRELEQKVYPFPDSDMDAMLDDLLKKKVIELPECKRPEEMNRINDPKYCKYHRIVGYHVGKEGRREIEKDDRERETEELCVCVCVWKKRREKREREGSRERETEVTMNGGHLCVCVWVPPVRRTHDSLHILDNTNNYLDNFMQLLPLSSVVFSNHGRWFHSKPSIPDPFQSLNTKGSIFKVSLQTYIYIIVIYTTTNKFVWTRMLIFLSN